MRILGLDVGDRRIGVALSDPTGILATALTVINRTEDGSDMEAILKLTEEKNVECIVVGLPLSMDGSMSEQAEKSSSFAEELSAHTGVPVKMWDERLSTSIASKLMRDTGSNSRQIKERRDSAAAALILQSYLDHRDFE